MFHIVTGVGNTKRDQSTQNTKFGDDFAFQIITGSYPIILSLIAATNYSFTHRMAASMRKRIVQDFQMQLFKTCGIRSLVLTAYEGEDHDLNICLYAMHLYILIQS